MSNPLEPTAVTTRAEHAALAADARNRALRTFLQGLGLDVLGAVAVALTLWLPDADLTSKEAWIVLGVGLLRTVLGSVASYVMRMFMDPSRLPTPLPPEPQPEPADPGNA